MIHLADINHHLDEIKRNQECIIYKPIGMTPLELLNICIKECGFKKGTFCGRLDPMAHGASLFLFDDKCSQKDIASKYILGKTYKFKMIVGMKTSTLDLLGISTVHSPERINVNDISAFITGCIPGYCQTLPDYCSYRVANADGVKMPLWWWASRNRLVEVKVPGLLKNISKFEIIGEEMMTLDMISKTAIERVSKITPGGSFNEEAVLKEWEKHIGDERMYQVITISVDVGTGFYIRSLVRDIGEALGVPTATFEIERVGYLN